MIPEPIGRLQLMLSPHGLAADAVWAVQWSATSEWVVITGGCDGAIRLWDVRRAGCFLILDHNKSWQVEKQRRAAAGRRCVEGTGGILERGRQVGCWTGEWITASRLTNAQRN